jgi:uncharacterized lipoprotein YddW (UPF0748 family)
MGLFSTALKAGQRFLQIAAMASLILVSCKKPTEVGWFPPEPEPLPPPVWDVNALRGMWVTTTASTALNSRANIKQMVTDCKAAGINNIFMVVYNQARTMYPSQVMNSLIGKPILESMTGRDPLQECIEEAHAQGLKVHAWFEYGFASSYSQNGGAIVQAKPHWAAKDINGNLVVKNGFDWLNPIHPEVQQFMTDLFMEVVNKYDLDGVQGDDRMPAMPTSGGYDPFTVALYQSEHGGANPPNNIVNAAWLKWRADKLTDYLKTLRDAVKARKPNMQFTVSPSPFPFGYNEYLQDWPTWVDRDLVDAILPQCYRYDINGYNSVLAQQKSFYRNPKVAFWPGVLLRSGSYVAPPQFLSQMIQTNRTSGFKGECYFFFEGLRDNDARNWFKNQYPYIK